MKKLLERPVFFDDSGKRWKRTKIFAAAGMTMSAVFFTLTLPSMIAPVEIPEFAAYHFGNRPDLIDNRTPAEIAYTIDRDSIPIIGEGPLIRVVRLTKDWSVKAAVDPYTGQAVKTLTDKEVKAAGNADYAIERYGKTTGKRIALTFDDGPDPVYTPKILDVLAEEKAASTFFAVGSGIVKYQDVAERIAREGHVLANHTFSHVDLDMVASRRAEQEITQAQRVLRSVNGRNPVYFRIPYGGNDPVSLRDDIRAILEAQRLGYTVASYDIDSNDWGFTGRQKPELPELDGSDRVILLHDGGGNREHTLSYLRNLIAAAKEKGYTFVSLEGLYPDKPHVNAMAAPTLADKTTHTVARALLAWPKRLVKGLFVITVGMLFVSMLANVILAALQLKKSYKGRRSPNYRPLVSVIIPAYNEEKVLTKSVRSVARSYYRNFEIIIVDDGSKDKTWQIVTTLMRNPKVRGVHQRNAGKAAAINRGLAAARGEIIISMDADTIFPRKALGKFVRHFADPNIGAVAGTVKVGNIANIITRWQALEYITSINVERAAQAYLNAIMIVPGACSAWRKSAILAAHGYSNSTLAEDCDLTLMVRKAGYRITQDTEAEAYTEAPQTLRSLAKQRFRWTFGNIQVFWKHRDMVFNRKHGWLGNFIIPRTMLSLSMQLVFAPLLVFVSFGNIVSGEIFVVLFYFTLSNLILMFAALVGVLFAREHFRHLSATPFYRLAYGPMRTFLLYSSFVTALKGFHVGWNKVTRTGAVNVRHQK